MPDDAAVARRRGEPGRGGGRLGRRRGGVADVRRRAPRGSPGGRRGRAAHPARRAERARCDPRSVRAAAGPDRHARRAVARRHRVRGLRLITTCSSSTGTCTCLAVPPRTGTARRWTRSSAPRPSSSVRARSASCSPATATTARRDSRSSRGRAARRSPRTPPKRSTRGCPATRPTWCPVPGCCRSTSSAPPSGRRWRCRDRKACRTPTSRPGRPRSPRQHLASGERPIWQRRSPPACPARTATASCSACPARRTRGSGAGSAMPGHPAASPPSRTRESSRCCGRRCARWRRRPPCSGSWHRSPTTTAGDTPRSGTSAPATATAAEAHILRRMLTRELPQDGGDDRDIG